MIILVDYNMKSAKKYQGSHKSICSKALILTREKLQKHFFLLMKNLSFMSIFLIYFFTIIISLKGKAKPTQGNFTKSRLLVHFEHLLSFINKHSYSS